MATPNLYTPEQISALRSLRHRLSSAKYNWEVRQLLKNTASATGLKQVQLVQWQDGDNNRKNLLHYLVDERIESKCPRYLDILLFLYFPCCGLVGYENTGLVDAASGRCGRS